TFHLLGRQGLGQGRQSPLRHLGHGRGEIDGNVPTPSKKPEEGTKRAHHELRPARTNRLQLPEEKARHLRRTHVIHHDGARPKAMSEKAPNEGQAVCQRRLRQPTLHAEVPSELASKPLQLRLNHIRHRTRNNSILPERLQQITQCRRITPTTTPSSEILDDLVLVYFSRQEVSSLQP